MAKKLRKIATNPFQIKNMSVIFYQSSIMKL